MKHPLKLHLGCGRRKIHGFVNVDALASVKPDVVADVFTLTEFKPNSADLIYACHVLEHSTRATCAGVLSRWFEVLKPGGVLRIAVPDLRAAVQWYSSHGDLREILGFLYGGQSDKYDHHGMGWDYASLAGDLLRVGFGNIKPYDWRATEHFFVDDYSQSYLPAIGYFTRRVDGIIGGKQMSLNLEATKP